MAIGDFAPGIFSGDRSDRNLIQRILRKGRTDEDPVAEAAAPAVTPADQPMPSARQQRRAERRAERAERRGEPTTAPRDPLAGLDEGSEDLLGVENAPALSGQRDIELLEAADTVTTPAGDMAAEDFDFSTKQQWRGEGNYFYSYTPASGNKPAEILLHGGRFNRENPVRLTETGPKADMFREILIEANKLQREGRAGDYVTPQKYREQRREAGVPSPMTDAQRAEQVGQEMFDFELAPAADTVTDSTESPTYYAPLMEIRAGAPAQPKPPARGPRTYTAEEIEAINMQNPMGAIGMDTPSDEQYQMMRDTRRKSVERAPPRSSGNVTPRSSGNVLRGEPIPMLDQAMNLMGFGEPTLRSLQSQATRALADRDIEEAVRIGRQIQAQFPNDPTAQNIGQSFIDQQRA